MKICPKCGNNEFLVTALLEEDWYIDGSGNVMNKDPVQHLTKDPIDNNEWVCTNCGYTTWPCHLREVKNETTGIAECVFDLTMIAHEIINDCDCATDIDSRELFFEIKRLAEEFERDYDEKNDDYMTKIEEYGVNKLREYLGVSRCYETEVKLKLVCREMTSDPDGVSFDHEKRIRRMASDFGYDVIEYESTTKEVE